MSDTEMEAVVLAASESTTQAVSRMTTPAAQGIESRESQPLSAEDVVSTPGKAAAAAPSVDPSPASSPASRAPEELPAVGALQLAAIGTDLVADRGLFSQLVSGRSPQCPRLQHAPPSEPEAAPAENRLVAVTIQKQVEGAVMTKQAGRPFSSSQAVSGGIASQATAPAATQRVRAKQAFPKREPNASETTPAQTRSCKAAKGPTSAPSVDKERGGGRGPCEGPEASARTAPVASQLAQQAQLAGYGVARVKLPVGAEVCGKHAARPAPGPVGGDLSMPPLGKCSFGNTCCPLQREQVQERGLEVHLVTPLPEDSVEALFEWAIEIRFEHPTDEDFVEKVVFSLHNTFKEPRVTVTEKPFRVVRAGWGTFPIIAKLHLRDKSTATLMHSLKFDQDGRESFESHILASKIVASTHVAADGQESGSARTAAFGQMCPWPKASAYENPVGPLPSQVADASPGQTGPIIVYGGKKQDGRVANAATRHPQTARAGPYTRSSSAAVEAQWQIVLGRLATAENAAPQVPAKLGPDPASLPKTSLQFRGRAAPG